MVTEQSPKPQVIRSSFCYNHGDCVEVERRGDVIAVRHSNADWRGYRVELLFTLDEWRAFVAGVNVGDFDPLLVDVEAPEAGDAHPAR